MNANSASLKRAFESAGFTDVKTIRSSGNVAFSARAASEASLQRKAEAAMRQHLGTAFFTIVRPIDALRELIASDPYRAFRLSRAAKRIVTFLRDQPTSQPALPIDKDGARILLMKGREVPNGRPMKIDFRHDVDQVLEDAKMQRRPVLLDFSAAPM